MNSFAIVVIALLATGAPQTGVLVAPSGEVQRVTLADWTALPAQGAIWRWTSDKPPARSELPLPEVPVDATNEPLQVDLQFATPECRGTLLSVIAAPTRMWEEVPEHLLPRWNLDKGKTTIPRAAGEPYRVRIVGESAGSWWQDVVAHEGVARIVVERSADRELRLEPAAELEGVIVHVLSSGDKREEAATIARIDGANASFALTSIPVARRLELVIEAAGFVDTALRAAVETLPGTLHLERGAMLEGRLTDNENYPLANVTVTLSGWIPGELVRSYSKEATTSSDGGWRCSGIPFGETLLTIVTDRYVPYHERLTVDDKRLNLGPLELRLSVELPAKLTDETGRPIPDATIEWRTGTAQTDTEGDILIKDVDPTATLRVVVSAPGLLPKRLEIEPPFPEVAALKITRGLNVTGWFLDMSGRPIPESWVTAIVRNRSTRRIVQQDGSFDIPIRTEIEAEILLTSPTTAPIRVHIEPGTQGEVRNVGVVLGDPGAVVKGTLISSIDGRPVIGARVWAPRETGDEALLAWIRGNLAEATSDAEGTFHLRGLSPGPARLTIDSEGFARATQTLILTDDGIDLGRIPLDVGCRVTVVVENATRGAVARIDTQGEWLETDMLTKAIEDGKADFDHVPEGDVWMSVVDGNNVICDEEVRVTKKLSPVKVNCRRITTNVHGKVTSGGRPVARGLLIWSRSSLEPKSSAIVKRHTSTGLLRTDVFGAGPPTVTVAIDDKGRFETQSLRPGHWTVKWLPDGGGESEPRTRDILDLDQQRIDLAYGDASVAGRVVDESEQGIPDASVFELHRMIATLADPSGYFTLVGLSHGPLRLQASDGNRKSQILELAAPHEDEVTLMVGSEHPQLVVAVLATNGRAVSDARVFVQTEQALLFARTNAKGEAAIDLEMGTPTTFRIAVLAGNEWILGSWAPGGERMPRTTTVRMASTGVLRATTNGEAGLLAIRSANDWDLGNLLQIVGASLRVSSDQPLAIPGLPVGEYSVSLRDSSKHVTIRMGTTTDVSLH